MSAQLDPLYPYWQRLAHFTGWEEAASIAAYQDVIARYDEPQRHFHTRAHLENIFRALEIEKYKAEDQAFLIATTFWHDAIYETASVDIAKVNEENSARLCTEQLEALGTQVELTARVAQTIRDSSTHVCDATADPVAAAFLDADMATLGGSGDDYVIGSAQINREFEPMGADFFAARIERFIDPLLRGGRIYLLDANEKRWGDAARANLTRERSEIVKKTSGDQ